MYKVALLISFILMSLKVFAFDIPMDDFFNFFKGGQDTLQAPLLKGESCEPLNPNKKDGFNAAQCVKEICPEAPFNLDSLGDLGFSFAIQCAINKDQVISTIGHADLCEDVRFKKYFPEIKDIAEKLKKFMKTELDLTGKRIRASIDYIKEPTNENSPFDNFGSNIGDLWVFIIENDDLFKIKEDDTGLKFSLNSERKVKRRLNKFFKLDKKDEDAAINVINALFKDSNSIFAAEMLGPEYVMKKVLSERAIEQDPDEAMKKIKNDAIGKIKQTLGKESIDPEYKNNKAIITDRETLVIEALIVDSLAKRLSPETLRRMSKADFTKMSFYNREKFDRDWTAPFEEKYNSTLQYLEGLARLYAGENEMVSDSDIYSLIGNIINGVELLPEEEELNTIKSKVPGFFDNYFKKLGSEFSNHSTTKIKGEVDKIHINYPRTKKKFLSDLQEWLDYRQAVADDTSKQLSDKSNKKAKTYFGRTYLQSLLLGESEEGGVSELRPLVSINPLPDFYIGTYNGIKMGPFAVSNFDSSGKQVLGHELGHHVGDFMGGHPLSSQTTSKFEKVRQCLASSHKDKSKEVKKEIKALGKKKFKWKENLYTEEDFSDWISAKTSDGNFACELIKGLDLTAEEKHLFENQNKKDTHSSAFYRLINIHLHQKGSLPASCQSDYVKKCPQDKIDQNP